MPYVTEWAATAPINPKFVCKNCGENDVWFREWESSDGAHDDVVYDCRSCKSLWWVEGPDY